MSYNHSEIVSSALIQSWRGFGNAGEFAFDMIGDTAIFNSHIHTSAFNYAYSSTTSNIGAVLGYFNGLPFTWIVESNNGDILRERGFKYDDSLLGMTMDLTDQLPDDEVFLVDDDVRLGHWIDIVTEGFQIDRNLTEAFARPLHDQVFFVAYVDEKPASALILSLCDEAVFLSYVATTPNLRRRGAGSKLTNGALRYAYDKGYKVAALMSSRMAENVYRSVGFRDDTRFSFWERG